MSIPEQAITFDATGSVLRFGRSPMIAGAGETLHIMTDLTPPNTDNKLFWKVVGTVFAAMTTGEKTATIAWIRERAVYDIGNSGAAFTVDWANGKIQKVQATDNATITMVTTESFINNVIPDEEPESKYLIVYNSGGTRNWMWPSNTYWPDGGPSILAGKSIIAFHGYNGEYFGQKYKDGA